MAFEGDNSSNTGRSSLTVRYQGNEREFANFTVEEVEVVLRAARDVVAKRAAAAAAAAAAGARGPICLWNLPPEVGVLVLEALDTGEMLRLGSISRALQDWVHACVPHIKSLRCLEWAGCGTAAGVISLNDRYGPLGVQRLHLEPRPSSTLHLVSALAAGLQRFDAAECSTVDEDVVNQLVVGSNHQLRHINFQRCKHVTDEAVAMIALHSPNLQHLNLADCRVSDDSIRVLAGSCLELQHLDLGWSEEVEYEDAGEWHMRVTDESIVRIGARCRQLRFLDVGNRIAVTDDSISLVTDCPHMQHLRVSGCAVTDVSIQRLGEQCPALRDLAVFECEGVSDISIRAVAAGCPHLTSLDAGRCDLVTDSSISAIGQQCTELQYLNVKSCEGVTAKSIQVIAENCAELQHLELSFCPGVTEASIQMAVQRCPKLRWLYMDACDQITEPFVRRMRELVPWMQIHAMTFWECDT